MSKLPNLLEQKYPKKTFLLHFRYKNTSGGQISPKVFWQKISAILGTFGDIGTFGDMRAKNDVLILNFFYFITSFTLGSNKEKYQNV